MHPRLCLCALSVIRTRRCAFPAPPRLLSPAHGRWEQRRGAGHPARCHAHLRCRADQHQRQALLLRRALPTPAFLSIPCLHRAEFVRCVLADGNIHTTRLSLELWDLSVKLGVYTAPGVVTRSVLPESDTLCRTPLQLFPHICRGAAQRCPKTPLSPGLFCVLSHSQSLQLRESPGTMPPKCAIERPRPASASSLRPAACCTLRPICIHASAVWRCGGVSRRWSSPRPPTDTSRGKMDRQSLLRRSIGVCFWSQEVLARQAPHRPPRRR